MKKKLFVVFLCVAMIVAFAAPAMASEYDSSAEELKTMGLFLGTDQGFELDRAANRFEAGTMLVRLLGAEDEAAAQFTAGTATHPFTDVPAWADPYVAWLYTEGLTKGSTETTYGAGDCTAQMYCTFLLRALGYSDANGDFSYDKAVDFASQLGIYSSEAIAADFWRDDAVALSCQALATNVKGGDKSLVEKLVADGAIDSAAASDFIAKQAAYREFSKACAATSAATAIAMTMKGSMDYVCPELELNAKTTQTGYAKTIVNGSDIKAEISTVITTDGVSSTLTEWIKDGAIYVNVDGTKYKMDMGLEDILATIDDMTGSVTSESDPIYMIDSIVKNADGSYTVTYGAALSSMVDSVLSGLEFDAGATVDIKKMALTVSFDSKGQIDALSTVMTMDIGVVYEGVTYTVTYDYDMDFDITAYGDAVTISFPDFTGYEPLVVE